MKSQNTKSSDELHKEVRHELRNVRKDIDQLQGRLTPGQLIDDAIFYPHGRSTAATLDHLKRNPVGTAFLSLGTIMLMEDEAHQTVEANAKVKLSNAKVKLNDLKDDVKERVRNQMPHKELAAGMTPNMADLAKDKVSKLKDTVQTKVSDIKGGVQSKVEDLKSQIPEGQKMREQGTGKLDSAKEKIGSTFESGKEKISNLEPMTYMALGLGLGALTGAALPITDAEQQFVDNKLHTRLSTFNQDLQTAINDCSNILKDLVIQDVKNIDVKIF